MNEGHKASHSAEKHEDRGVGIFDEAKERYSEMADEAKARGEKLIEVAKDRGSELMDEAQNHGKNAVHGVQTYIQTNPGKAVSYAMAAGAFLYAFLRRKHK